MTAARHQRWSRRPGPEPGPDRTGMAGCRQFDSGQASRAGRTAAKIRERGPRGAGRNTYPHWTKWRTSPLVKVTVDGCLQGGHHHEICVPLNGPTGTKAAREMQVAGRIAVQVASFAASGPADPVSRQRFDRFPALHSPPFLGSGDLPLPVDHRRCNSSSQQ